MTNEYWDGSSVDICKKAAEEKKAAEIEEQKKREEEAARKAEEKKGEERGEGDMVGEVAKTDWLQKRKFVSWKLVWRNWNIRSNSV